MSTEFDPKRQIVELCLTVEEAATVVGVLGIQARDFRGLGTALGEELSATLEGVAMRLITACGYQPVREDGTITAGPPLDASSCYTMQ